MNYRSVYFFLFLLLAPLFIFSQNFNRQDTLRGSISRERLWWDLLHYDLNVEVLPNKKYIKGYNTITYKVLTSDKTMQIDLQDPLRISRVTQNNQDLKFKKEGFAYFIDLQEHQSKGKNYSLTVYYEGNPVESKNPPWSGGFTWKKDVNENDFIATSCQGIGASIWWPNKDHMYDEPENGMQITVTCPEKLTDVSNGRLIKTIENQNKTKTYVWEVKNPINNYGVNINIADYVYFGETYEGLKGKLDCDYYVLSYNLEKAKEQFKQVPLMLEAFEHWFGPYPFYEDSFKLVEVPYLGMEHQSSVTYGNEYKNGYLGRDLSGSGWGLKWDFIIIHESGHEWFANNITYKDIADMWIHESFTAYSEALYTDYHFGTKAGNDYVIGTRRNIRNQEPIIGKYGVNHEGSGDMYPKGANMIHTIRQIINDDEKFRAILVGLNKVFYHQTVTTEQIENYISEQSGMDFSKIFDQYLRNVKIPVFEYSIEDKKIKYRFSQTIDDFSMPVRVKIDGKEKWLTVTNQWQEIKTDRSKTDFEIDRNFYVINKNLN